MSIWQREYSSPCSRSLLHPTLADEPLDLVAACRAIMRLGAVVNIIHAVNRLLVLRSVHESFNWRWWSNRTTTAHTQDVENNSRRHNKPLQASVCSVISRTLWALKQEDF
uniref:Uncharacterized protein n=1 Tax=Zea mays TaxID=4577 RepID=A0A804RN60_MAIZE